MPRGEASDKPNKNFLIANKDLEITAKLASPSRKEADNKAVELSKTHGEQFLIFELIGTTAKETVFTVEKA